MPGAHAILSPSASERWLSCPASVRLGQRLAEEGMIEQESSYAAEGTTAHALGEIELKHTFGQLTDHEYEIRFEKWLQGAELNDYDILEMRRHIADLVSLVQERLELYPNSVPMFEQRLATGIKSCWGTGDVVIVSPQHVEIIDLKYGSGVYVDAEENPQLMLYGCGALDLADMLGDVELVRMTIFQPRLEGLSTYERTADELRAWREEIRPVAAEALAGSDQFGPSEKACRWCPAAAICRKRVEVFTAIDFASEPDLLDNDELGDLLEQVKDMRQWLDKVEGTALHKLYSLGQEIPGWKVVRTNGRRSIVNDIVAIQRLVKAGFKRADVTRMQPQTLGALEKLVGKDKLPDILGDTLAKRDGKPAIAHISDGRPSISPNNDAAKDFEDE